MGAAPGRWRSAVRAAAAVLLALPLAAANAYASERGADIDLRITGERYQTDLDYPAGTVEQRTSRIGLQLYEVGDPRLQPGIHGGWIRSRIDGQAADAADGLRMDGHYLGAGVRSHLFHTNPVSLLGEIRYTWHSVDGSTDTQRFDLEWTELQARLGPVVRVGRLRWSVGGYVSRIDGDQDRDGGGSIAYREDRATGAFTQIDLMVDRTGYVGLHADSGGNAGLHVVFGRVF